jgi:two-component system response regulator CpxR
MKFLVVDDDAEHCASLREVLEEAGHSVDIEPDLLRKQTESYDLLIMDVADGFELLRRVRDRSQIPILVLSANAERADRVAGLLAGADEYLGKPFHADELLARIQSLLRRAGANGNAGQAIEIGELRLLPASREVYLQSNRLDLTAMEIEILECLMRSFGKAVSRDRLSLRLYNRLSAPFERNIDTHVSRLRRKMGDGGGMILSVRGTGYQIRSLPVTLLHKRNEPN